MRPRPLRRVAAAAFLLGLACDASPLAIEVERSASAVIESGTIVDQLVGDLGLAEFVGMDITADSELQNQGVEKGDVREVYLSRFVLRSEDGTALSFIDSVTIFVQAPDLERRQVAFADDFAGDEVDFEVEAINLKKYVVSESMTLSAEIDGQRPDMDVTVEATATLNVVATLQGACKAVRG